MDETNPEVENLADDVLDRPGTILRRAREAKGMSLAEVAEATRIAQRQLEAIERSDFASLPGTPYAVGFARAYARAVDADEVAVAHGVREELGALDTHERYEAFEPADPARVPPRTLAWAAAAIALVLAVGYGVWRTQFFSASTDQEIAALNDRAEPPRAALPQQQRPAEPAVSGPVVLTANQEVWLRIYDQAGERLFEKEMQTGESYTVPPEADNPMILTGRPDALNVTIGGKAVAPLGPPEKTIADVPVSATALLSRPENDAAPAAGAVPAAARSDGASAGQSGAATRSSVSAAAASASTLSRQ